MKDTIDELDISDYKKDNIYNIKLINRYIT